MKQTVETVRLREVKAPRVFKEVVKTHLTDEDRLSLAIDIICGTTTAEEVKRKYGIVSIIFVPHLLLTCYSLILDRKGRG